MDERDSLRTSGLALVFLAACTACRSSPPSPPSGQGVVHDLRIVRHHSATLFDQRAD